MGILSVSPPPHPLPVLSRSVRSLAAPGRHWIPARAVGSSIPDPPSPAQGALTRILDSGIIACLRADSSELAIEAARAALTGGVSVLEIIVSTPGVFEVVPYLVKEFPTSLIGVGTILDIKQGKIAVEAGAKFLMSPITVKEMLIDGLGDEALYIPGAMTPSEIFSAYESGAKIVKVYPVSVLGGVNYISVLRRPFTYIPMVASQGVTLDSVKAYIQSGCSAVVLSDAIFDKEAMRTRNFNAICQLSRFATQQGKQAVSYHRKSQDKFV